MKTNNQNAPYINFLKALFACADALGNTPSEQTWNYLNIDGTWGAPYIPTKNFNFCSTFLESNASVITDFEKYVSKKLGYSNFQECFEKHVIGGADSYDWYSMMKEYHKANCTTEELLSPEGEIAVKIQYLTMYAFYLVEPSVTIMEETPNPELMPTLGFIANGVEEDPHSGHVEKKWTWVGDK